MGNMFVNKKKAMWLTFMCFIHIMYCIGYTLAQLENGRNPWKVDTI